MTDTERIDALDAFCLPGSVWVRNVVRDKGVLSTVAVPLRPVQMAYAVMFAVPYWADYRTAIDAWVQDEETNRRAKCQSSRYARTT